ncbi:DUF6009 family protein [Streptomyces polyrhachis]|uniref:DUF6009 family protein n=1 Tax=Streptomyces polyrhachis TaxID=1282885 RepID=A0ABW2GMU1_9ACTN
MSSLLGLNEDALSHELEIHWIEPPEQFDYVRQALDKTPRRGNRPRYERDGRMVGYAILGKGAEADPDSGLYRRRVFFVLPIDRSDDPEGIYRQGAPGEAIDPLTVEATVAGRKTPRSQLGQGAALTSPPAQAGGFSAGRR